MNANEWLKIIEILPQYIIYLYPGYLTIYIYSFLRGRCLKESKAVILKALVISYIYVIIVNELSFNNIILYNIMYILISLIIAYISYQIVKSDIIIHIFEILGINTRFYDNEMESLAEFDKGAWLIIYLNDESIVYEGSLGLKEMDTDKQRYIILNKYRKYKLDNSGEFNGVYISDYSKNKNESVMIFFDNINRIEKRDS